MRGEPGGIRTVSEEEVRIALEILRTVAAEKHVDLHRLGDEIDANVGRLFQTCRRLARSGLIERSARSGYRLTDTGAALVDGDLRLSTSDPAADGFRWAAPGTNDERREDVDLVGLVR